MSQVNAGGPSKRDGPPGRLSRALRRGLVGLFAESGQPGLARLAGSGIRSDSDSDSDSDSGSARSRHGARPSSASASGVCLQRPLRAAGPRSEASGRSQGAGSGGPARPGRDGGPGPSSRPRFGWAMRWGAPLVLIGVAAIAVLVARPSAPVIAALAALLACVCAVIGWLVGEERRAELRREIEHRTHELTRALSELEIAQAETVRRLSMAVEFRDEDTGAHIERIGRFSQLLAEQLQMEPEFCERLSHAAPLHDVGKVAIPDAILLKPGPLTAQERSIVETHAEEGHRLLRGSSSSILDLAATIALSHHEKWDGTGYPRGLSGEQIPVEGRIVAIADVFDALTTDRVYRSAFPVEDAVAMMTAQRGRHFDPTLLDAFFAVLGDSGPDAKPQQSTDPHQLVGEVFDRYAAAIERGDAETAEGVIAQAIEDGVPTGMLHEDVIGGAMRRIADLAEHGEIDAGAEQLATGISRRILATLHRYMLRGAEPTRERVLIAGVGQGEQSLSLQMIHDQLAGAGYRTAIEANVTVARLRTLLRSHRPELIVLGGEPTAATSAIIDEVVEALVDLHPELPIALGGRTAPERLLRGDRAIRLIERVDEAADAVERMLATREGVLS